MKNINKPSHSAKSTYKTCISNIRNSTLKARLAACESLIDQAEKDFMSKITKGLIHTIPEESIVNTNVTVKELKKIYDQKMVPSSAPGRFIYDSLFNIPKYGICPLCGHREVESLDHYLPKTKFPRLVVTPLNLIPACNKCNKGKLADVPKKPEEETLHPYFDNIENDHWLFAKINITSPLTISFYASPPVTWTKLLQDRTKHHFEAFELGKLYSVQSAGMLSRLSKRLNDIGSKKGELGIQKYLFEEALSRCNEDKNSWQTALYFTLSNDIWFCRHGYKQI